MNNYIDTLDDRDLSRMLTMLRLGGADDVEETLQECKHMNVRENRASMGSKIFRQLPTSNADKCQRNHLEL